MAELPSAEKRARRVCHWPGHLIGLPDERCKECKAVVSEILADRNAVLEAVMDEIADCFEDEEHYLKVRAVIRKLQEEQ